MTRKEKEILITFFKETSQMMKQARREVRKKYPRLFQKEN